MLPAKSPGDPRRPPAGRQRPVRAFTLHSFETSVRIKFLQKVQWDRAAFEEVVVLERSFLTSRLLMKVQLPSECSCLGDDGRPGAGARESTELPPGDRVLVYAVPARQVEDVAS